MYEFDAEILSIIQRTENVKSFRVTKLPDVKFSPGQYLAVTVDTLSGKKTKPLSFSSSPTETGYIEFTKRLTESDFSRALDGMNVGGKVHLRLPFGKFTFEGEHPKIVLLAGGIGITPFRSICKNATDRKLASDIILLYGNKTEKDMIFKEDLDAMSRSNSHLKIIYALTSCEDGGTGSGFIKGYFDGPVIKEKVADHLERIFYVCGPPGMVNGLAEILEKELDVPEDNIRIEQFMGY